MVSLIRPRRSNFLEPVSEQVHFADASAGTTSASLGQDGVLCTHWNCAHNDLSSSIQLSDDDDSACVLPFLICRRQRRGEVL